MLVPTFAKSCKIQDDYPQLCFKGYLDLSNTTCTTDTANKYYKLYGGEKYPATICDNSCGAFVNNYSIIYSFLEFTNQSNFFFVLYEILFAYPYLPWSIIIILCILLAMRKNSLYVMKLVSFNKEKVLEMQIMTINAVLL